MTKIAETIIKKLFRAKRTETRKWRLWATTIIVLAVHATNAHGVILESHRAAYQVQLVESRGQLTSAAGLMTIESTRACKGWSVITTLRMQYQYSDGTTADTEVTFSSVENRMLYQFSFVELINDVTARQVRGNAVLTERGGDGVAHFQLPEQRDEFLPRGTLFPMAHLLDVMIAAEYGKQRIGRFMFDITRGNNSLFEVTTLILSGIRPHDDGPGTGLGELTKRPWWPVRMAFYSQRSRGQAPDYEVISNLQDNGVVRAYMIEDENMVLEFTLSAIEPLPPPQC